MCTGLCHHCALQLLFGVYADMLCLGFTNHNTLHQGQTSSLCSRLSEGHFVCSVATLQTYAVLPRFVLFFHRGEAFSW